MGAVQPICEPLVPLNAMAGIPDFAASVAAPTVPEMSVVVPRFAVLEVLADSVHCIMGKGEGYRRR